MTDLPEDRILDAATLRALAHPLRVELYEALSSFGPATASGLAERLGESTGATSYHLRQLARHGLVGEVEGRGTGRERWWERTPGGISVRLTHLDTAAGIAAARQVSRQFGTSRARHLADFEDRAEEFGTEWYDASTISTMNISATAEELRALSAAFEKFVDEHIDPLRLRELTPGMRRVQVHINAFPIIDTIGPEVDPTPPVLIPTPSEGK